VGGSGDPEATERLSGKQWEEWKTAFSGLVFPGSAKKCKDAADFQSGFWAFSFCGTLWNLSNQACGRNLKRKARTFFNKITVFHGQKRL
jgi:hypothetical protein